MKVSTHILYTEDKVPRLVHRHQALQKDPRSSEWNQRRKPKEKESLHLQHMKTTVCIWTKFLHHWNPVNPAHGAPHPCLNTFSDPLPASMTAETYITCSRATQAPHINSICQNENITPVLCVISNLPLARVYLLNRTEARGTERSFPYQKTSNKAKQETRKRPAGKRKCLLLWAVEHCSSI